MVVDLGEADVLVREMAQVQQGCLDADGAVRDGFE